jgi:hypothetical protein
MYKKLPIYLFSWRLDLMILMGKSITQAIGSGGPKKVSIFRAHPFQRRLPASKSLVPDHINKRYIISYYKGVRVLLVKGHNVATHTDKLFFNLYFNNTVTVTMYCMYSKNKIFLDDFSKKILSLRYDI